MQLPLSILEKIQRELARIQETLNKTLHPCSLILNY